MSRGLVLIVEDDGDLRDVLSELYATADEECLAVGSLRALEQDAGRALSADLAILDINLGPEQPSGVDVYDWLNEHRFRGRVVFLTGHATSHPAVQEAIRRGNVVLRKPIAPAELLRLARDSCR